MHRRIMRLAPVLVAVLTGCVPAGAPPSERARAPTASTGRGTEPPPPGTSPAGPPSDCPHVPLGGFGEVWHDGQVWPCLGCAVAAAEPISGTEAYLCSGTHAIWLRERRLFVAIRDSGRRWEFVADESGLPADAPLMVAPTPPSPPCFEATGRHGWLARREGGDLSRSGETEFSGAMQAFEGGWLLWNGNVCFVLFSDGTWTMF